MAQGCIGSEPVVSSEVLIPLCDDYDDDDDNHDDKASGGTSVSGKTPALNRQKRQQFFSEPRVCVNCLYKFVRSAQYSGHLKQCKPSKPWNGKPTRSVNAKLPGGAAAVVSVRGTDEARVHKNVPVRRTLSAYPVVGVVPMHTNMSPVPPPSHLHLPLPRQSVACVQTAEYTTTLSSSPSCDSDAHVVGYMQIDQGYTAFVQHHMAMLTPCITREHLECVDGHFALRIEALHRMRSIAQSGIQKRQLME
jgi:hypothetical protein